MRFGSLRIRPRSPCLNPKSIFWDLISISLSGSEIYLLWVLSRFFRIKYRSLFSNSISISSEQVDFFKFNFNFSDTFSISSFSMSLDPISISSDQIQIPSDSISMSSDPISISSDWISTSPDLIFTFLMKTSAAMHSFVCVSVRVQVVLRVHASLAVTLFW